MTFEGLDYNTSRPKMRMPEYGRSIHLMVEHCVQIPDREERKRCAETIINAMARMKPEIKHQQDYMQKLWDHLAIMSDFKLDIDYPCQVTTAEQIAVKPDSLPYPKHNIPVRHYGSLIFRSLEHLKTMKPGEERNELIRLVANQMKRNVVNYGNSAPDNERVISDIARYSDGDVIIDPEKFVFEYINIDNRSSKKGKGRSVNHQQKQ